MKRFGLALCVGLVGLLPGPALAAFPGRDGLLAVQPLKGPGIVLVKANGRAERRLCQEGSRCARPGLRRHQFLALRDPSWSPDGRALAVSSRVLSDTQSELIYPDGSCLDCRANFYARDASFTSNPALFTAFLGPPLTGVSSGLYEFGVDGLGMDQQPLVAGSVSHPVWSSGGQLAVVEQGWIWVGSPAGLHRLALGSDPAWSPDGKEIVFDRDGWLMVRRLRAHSARRLVRGTAPAWSPNGTRVAFFDEHNRLSIVRSNGGHVRRVGAVTGRAVDWQPLVRSQPSGCVPAPGSAVIARSEAAVVSVDSGVEPSLFDDVPPGFAPAWTAMGCLRADGRERVLTGGAAIAGSSSNVSGGAVAGTYAALIVSDVSYKYEAMGESVELFDLRTGAKFSDRGDETTGGCFVTDFSAPPCVSMDQLVLGSDAVSAVHTTVEDTEPNGSSCTCTVEQIQARDSTGPRTLDSISEPEGSPPALTNLALTGDTLTWEHDGVPRSAQLQP